MEDKKETGERGSRKYRRYGQENFVSTTIRSKSVWYDFMTCFAFE